MNSLHTTKLIINRCECGRNAFHPNGCTRANRPYIKDPTIDQNHRVKAAYIVLQEQNGQQVWRCSNCQLPAWTDITKILLDP